ncbi:MAG: ABC transporter ATP-binding protein [Betaproteobacteria bacterium]
MTAITLTHITKRFGPVQVVSDLSLQIADREFLVLLGPSGCGKTTTMRMIAGLEAPTEGDILFGDVRINDVPPQERDVAMVFQNYGLYPHRNVADNIGYPLKLRGVAPAERLDRVRRAAARVQLEPFLARMPRELSGGQRQRVALARSIVRTPRLFLMDEPLSNLDAKLRVLARAQIKHLTEELQVTTVYVTHDQIEAMTLATRVAVMNEGVIRQIGTPEEVYSDPADTFVAGFIGSPAMNLLSVDASHEGICSVAGRPIGAQAPRQGRLVLGVRPEDLFLCDPTEALLHCEVFTFELLGDSTMLTAMVDDTLLTARAGKSLRLHPGERVALGCDRSRLYWFDGDTGLRCGLRCRKRSGSPGYRRLAGAHSPPCRSARSKDPRQALAGNGAVPDP